MIFQIGSGPFQQILNNMENMGIFLYLFPFLLALSMFYGLLEFIAKDRIPKAPRGIISIILAFFVMLYSSWNVAIVGFFAGLGGGGLIIGSAILVLLIMLGLVGLKTDELFRDNKMKWLTVAVLIIIVFLIAMGAGAGSLIGIPDWSNNGDFLTMIFFVFVILMAVWWLGNSGNAEKPTAPAGGKPG